MHAMLENFRPSLCLAGRGPIGDFQHATLPIDRTDMATLLQIEQMVRKTVAGLTLASKPTEKRAAVAMPAWNIHSASTKVGPPCART